MAAAEPQHATIIVYYRDIYGNFQILSGFGHVWVSDEDPHIVKWERVNIPHGSVHDTQEKAIDYFKQQVLDKHFLGLGYKFEKPKKKFIEGKGYRWTTKFYKKGNLMSLPKGGKEPGDENLLETARRELYEETSIGNKDKEVKIGLHELRGIELVDTTKIFLLP